MKKRILTLFIACLCLVTLKNSFATSHHDTPPDQTPIELRGTLDLGHGPNSVEAYTDGNSVYVCFHQNFGNVSISLYNAWGMMVYSNVVNTAVQQTVVIPITSNLGGTYTLVLDSANGYAEGDFERELL